MLKLINTIKFWIKHRYSRIINSIAFYPAFIAFVFLLVAFAAIWFDFSVTGLDFKRQQDWLSLKDASAARSIIAVIAGGIISLTVFSFSMVMIVLNQAASHMTNRVLNKLIGNRFQQIVLGFYIGTIVFSMFLLSTIRDVDSGIYIPSISTYLLIILSIIDIFLFIYFLHYITQAVKYEVIINKIYDETITALENNCSEKEESAVPVSNAFNYTIKAPVSGVYEGFDDKRLLEICDKNDCKAETIHLVGTYILEGFPVLKINRELPQEIVESIHHSLYLQGDENIENNFLYGFKQLTEIALKALSPGINDPGTASLCLRVLFRLLAYRISSYPVSCIKSENGTARIFVKSPSFTAIFERYVLPVWDYGKDDRIIQTEFINLITQFRELNRNDSMETLLQKVKEQQVGL